MATRRIVSEEIADTTDAQVSSPRGGQNRSSYYRIGNIIYIIFGLLELLLMFRFIFLLLGANQANGFVNFIYSLSQPFVAPFYGIFGTVSYSKAVLDPATIVAAVIYAIVAWVIIRIAAAADNRPADPV